MSFLSATRRTVLSVIDFFHRPFARWIDPQTFRYLASGGSNVALNWLVYVFSYHLVFRKQPVHVFQFEIAPHVGAFVIAFCVSFPYGFLMSRYVVFTESTLRGRVQLFRYSLLVLVCLWMNYVLIKLFVEHLHFFPSISYAVIQAIVALFSYTSQRFFTFRTKPTDPLTEEVFLEGETDAMEI